MPAALHAYARTFNGMGTAILSMTPETGHGVIHSPDIAEASRAYADHWWQHDFRVFRAEQRRLKGILTDLDLTTEEERAAHPFYQEFARCFGISWFCAQTVWLPGAAPLSISIQRSNEFGPFSPAEIDELAPLGRHASRVVDIAAKIAHATSNTDALCDCLMAFGYGLFGLSANGRVLFTNTITDDAVGIGLQVTGGRLVSSSARFQGALDALVSETLSLSTGRTSAPPRPITIPRANGRVPLAIYGIPVVERHADLLTLLGGRPKALLVVVEPDAKRYLDAQLLAEMFALSPGEARIAVSIALGATVEHAAQEHGIAESTCRTVLKNVFRKVGVSRQVELVLLFTPLLRR